MYKKGLPRRKKRHKKKYEKSKRKRLYENRKRARGRLEDTAYNRHKRTEERTDD